MAVNKKDALVAQLTETVSALVEKIAELEGKLVAAPPVAKERKKPGEPRPGTFYEVKGYFKKEHKQPPQCLLLSKWAFEAAQALGRNITEPELCGAFMTHEAEWLYDQSMWEVWAYYRPRMIKAGHVRML